MHRRICNDAFMRALHYFQHDTTVSITIPAGTARLPRASPSRPALIPRANVPRAAIAGIEVTAIDRVAEALAVSG